MDSIEFFDLVVEDNTYNNATTFVSNGGILHARNVDVKFYDGDNLIGDTTLKLVPAKGGPVVVFEEFTPWMRSYDEEYEPYNIMAFVNKYSAIDEGNVSNYDNNNYTKKMIVYRDGACQPRLYCSVEYLNVRLDNNVHIGNLHDEDLELDLTIWNLGPESVMNVTITLVINGKVEWKNHYDTVEGKIHVTKEMNAEIPQSYNVSMIVETD